MTLPKRYIPQEEEPALIQFWQNSGIYQFNPNSGKPIYSVDTPPPTVSGNLHLGHVYSYSHPDFIVRFQRMRGMEIFYPMGFDDNGLPTERLVEKRFSISAEKVGRKEFIDKCLEVSDESEKDYKELWKRLGLSIDWRFTYRTIDENSRKIAQKSFLELYKQGKAYRQETPAIWCPECKTTIAQADLNDLERNTEFFTILFSVDGLPPLQIGTTRPELLPACVAVFVHPEDRRYTSWVGAQAVVPIFGQKVPILSDPAADPEKGTGVVMCCTFGDQADVAWWYKHHLPRIDTILQDGTLGSNAQIYAGFSIAKGRRAIINDLENQGLILHRDTISQSIRVHERCDTPVETIVFPQWFFRILPDREKLLEAGEKIHWHPAHMGSRYRSWVENLAWDWCISRQRYFGVPFPIWYCESCGKITIAQEEQLPVDPTTDRPQEFCAACGGESFRPETDVMDTWATSSMSPQIAAGWLTDPETYNQVFPMSLRPQAHEIIRTWAFYTISKSLNHFNTLPWENVLISGWGIAGEGMGKISKSRGGSIIAPMDMIQKHSADAVRYWAASTSPGKDAIISEEKIQLGSKLITKLWNVAHFVEHFSGGKQSSLAHQGLSYTTADLWISSLMNRLIQRVTEAFEAYDYAMAKSEIETFFWKSFTDNYLEMVKQRLYLGSGAAFEAALFTVSGIFNTLLKLFSPILPFVTERIYQNLYAEAETQKSIHQAAWPTCNPGEINEEYEKIGAILVEIASTVRRYKSEQNISLGTPIKRLQFAAGDWPPLSFLTNAIPDLQSITRADNIVISPEARPGLIPLYRRDSLTVWILP